MNKFVKIILIVIAVLVAVSIIAMTRFWWMQRSEQEVIGVSFSQVQAERYGSDWKDNYISMIDELGFRHIRIATYWDRIEKIPGEYDFSEIDFMIEEAKKRNAKITLVLGQKTIRVPECYYPSWLDKNDSNEVGSQVNKMIKATAERYKNEPVIEAWQLENEFLLRSFGDCPQQNLTREALNTELSTLKSVDTSRPIILTQSDQIGWPVSGPFGNNYGFSMYRYVWSPIGYYRYPQSGLFNWWKASIISWYANQKTKVHELQAEPWDKVGNENLEYERSRQTMNPKQLLDNLEYARQTQIKRIDLWGSEWWYAMRIQGHPEMWETVKSLPNKD